jgi:hypothetical protein
MHTFYRIYMKIPRRVAKEREYRPPPPETLKKLFRVEGKLKKKLSGRKKINFFRFVKIYNNFIKIYQNFLKTY